ncbi:cyclopropane fatty acyl phospholipid synthase [Desulfosediminicola ganghwensis]|uniref:cyclopropane fatty acyl phospholipid synthase n=1 Tax=Desulfosediminicola ganghwensis TaxID=2569540 RepID=UPI0010AD55CB|nr:cyclopropane fatty acyl phospholipid synthase [Desulfosediminicola ganghwensis]
MNRSLLTSPRLYLTNLLTQADVTVNGTRPWDIQVKNNAFFENILTKGSLALGESYIDGWWECEMLDEFIHRILRHRLDRCVRLNPTLLFNILKARLSNRQSRHRAPQVGERHYDAGNDLFELMLDRHMIYSCGFWQGADTLDQAQEIKLDLICRKLQLTQNMRLLDIGCGWGGLVEFAARQYGVEAVGITISREQLKFARERCAGLPVEIRLQDYREVNDQFDAIVSVGMFEHVGYKNYETFMKVVARCLAHNGLFLLHTIGSNRTTHTGDPWFDKYIFPNGMLPSAKQLTTAIEKLFILEDWDNFGTDYDKTLLAWHDNFERNWPTLKKRYSEKFYRVWNYYLLSMAGGFRARYMQVWQIVLSQLGRNGGYTSIRCPRCSDSSK